MIQATPTSRTTCAWRTYLGSSRLIAVSVTIVRIFSRAISRRSGQGRCQAPRKSRPGATTTTCFSTTSSQTSAAPSPMVAAPAPPRASRIAERRLSHIPDHPCDCGHAHLEDEDRTDADCSRTGRPGNPNSCRGQSDHRAMTGSIVRWALAPECDRAAIGGEGTELIKYSCSAQDRNRREVCGQ